MSANTLTFVLTAGTVSLEDFSEAVSAFSRIVTKLSEEMDAPGIEWEIADLEVGSAIATARTSDERAHRVVEAYDNLGARLAAGISVSTPSLRAPVNRFMRVLRRRETGARFETAKREHIISPVRLRREPQAYQALNTEPSRAPRLSVPTSSLGSVRGRIQTLTNRGALRFTLYDLFSDRAVSCYLREGDEGTAMLDKWGKIADVTGMVSRDPSTGRALAVRQIIDVAALPEPDADAYLQARGASPSDSDISPEMAIRRVRDGDLIPTAWRFGNA